MVKNCIVVNYKYLVLFLFLIYFGSSSKIMADNHIDSLQNLIAGYEKANLTDTVLNTRFELIQYVENSDYNLFLELAGQNINLARKYDKHWALIDIYMEIGEVLITKGIYGVALDNLNLAMNLAVTDEYKPYLGWINIAIGNAYSGMLNYSKSIDFYKAALNVFEQTKNTDGLGLAATNLGNDYSKLNDRKNAEYFLKLGLEYRKKLGNLVELRSCQMFYYEFEMSKGNYNEAESGLKTLAETLGKEIVTEKKDFQFQEAMVLQAEVLSLLADCENHFNNSVQEFNYLGKAAEIYRGIHDDLHLSYIYNRIGNRYLMNGNYQKPMEYADFAFGPAKKSIILTEQLNSYKLKADVYYSLGKFKEALEYFKAQKMMSDSIFSKSVIQAISNVDVLTKTLEKEKDYQILNLKIEQDRKFRFLILTVSFAFIVVIFLYSLVLYKRLKKEQRLGILLKESNNQILEQTHTLEKLNSELLQLNKSKDKFHSIIAHDLRSPVATFFSIIDLLRETYDTLPDERIKEFIEMAHQTSENNLKLLDNLLAWSRIQVGHLNVNKSEFYISDAVKEAVVPVKLMAELKNISLVITPMEPVLLNADKEMISTVVRNFCTNAVKFTKGGNKIQVGSNQLDGMIEVWVKDEGIGISQDKLVELFEINSQTHRQGTNNETGTGLGLQLCQEFVKLHNGKIIVESEVGIGSRFAFIIPVEYSSI